MLIRANDVKQSDPFKQDVESLRGDFPEIEMAVRQLSDILHLAINLPHRSVRQGSNVYAIRSDYPPAGSNGRGAFLVTYHATPRNVPATPNSIRVYTLLTITT